jgi:hypothetical protein
VYVDGLDPGTTYHFRAAAQNAAGWGLDNVVSATTPATTPSAPTACSAIQSSYNIMYVDWNAPASDGGSSIINYNIVIEKGQKAWVWVIPPPQLGSWGYYYWHQLGIVVDYDTVGAFTDYYEDLHSGSYRIYIRARNSVGLGPACVVDWVYIS